MLLGMKDWSRETPKPHRDRESLMPTRFTENYGREEIVAIHVPPYYKDHFLVVFFQAGYACNTQSIEPARVAMVLICRPGCQRGKIWL